MHTFTAYPSLTEFYRKLRGGSQPILVAAENQNLYVVKFRNNLQGENVLFNEAMGTALYRACGLSTPDWTPLRVTKAFLRHFPGCWLQNAKGAVQPADGLCFGSLYQGSATQVIEIMPSASLKRVNNLDTFWMAWVIDVCANHTDNRQALFLSNDDPGAFTAVFIDHGNLFGGPKGGKAARLFEARYLDQRVYQYVSSCYLRMISGIIRELDVDKLWRQAAELPAEWRTDSALREFSGCLNRLADVQHIQKLIDILWEVVFSQPNACAFTNPYRPKPPASVLCAGIQACRGQGS